MRPAFLASVVLLGAALPPASGQVPPSRGALLYGNHCVECHDARMHWRDQRLARDWGSLKAQVRRWQGEANLQWSEDEIDAVARHLNDTNYRLTPARPHARADTAR